MKKKSLENTLQHITQQTCLNWVLFYSMSLFSIIFLRDTFQIWQRNGTTPNICKTFLSKSVHTFWCLMDCHYAIGMDISPPSLCLRSARLMVWLLPNIAFYLYSIIILLPCTLSATQLDWSNALSYWKMEEATALPLCLSSSSYSLPCPPDLMGTK